MVWDGAKLTRGSGGGKLQRRSGAESNGGDGRKPTAGRPAAPRRSRTELLR